MITWPEQINERRHAWHMPWRVATTFEFRLLTTHDSAVYRQTIAIVWVSLKNGAWAQDWMARNKCAWRISYILLTCPVNNRISTPHRWDDTCCNEMSTDNYRRVVLASDRSTSMNLKRFLWSWGSASHGCKQLFKSRPSSFTWLPHAWPMGPI